MTLLSSRQSSSALTHQPCVLCPHLPAYKHRRLIQTSRVENTGVSPPMILPCTDLCPVSPDPTSHGQWAHYLRHKRLKSFTPRIPHLSISVIICVFYNKLFTFVIFYPAFLLHRVIPSLMTHQANGQVGNC